MPPTSQVAGPASFDARLHKPVRPARLLDTLRPCLRAGGGPVAAAASGPVEQPRGARLDVLVAEDHEVNAHLIGLYLRQLGHDCVRVANGQEVVAVTASVLASARTAFLGAGADEFLTKPVRLTTLDATLRRIVPAGGRPPAPAPPSAPVVPVPRPGEPLGEPLGDVPGDVLDGETVEELRDLGTEAFAHLYGTFADGLPDTLAALAEAVAGGAWSEDDERSVPRLAHRLKGSSAAMGALRMAELCQGLQAGTGAAPELDLALCRLQDEGRRVQAAVTSLLAGQHADLGRSRGAAPYSRAGDRPATRA